MGAHSNVEEWTVVAVNKTKAKIKAGGVAFGVAVGPYDVSSVELAGAMGFDFVVIDCEHDLFDPRGAEEMIRAADVSGMTPIVRIMNNPELILHLLDAGAQGVWVARVNSIDDAKRVVNAAKFHPEGTRTIFFRSRGGNFGLDVSNARQWTLDSNRETMIGCIIEGIGGVNVLSDILAMPEVDFIDLGPLDLAHSMGWPEQKSGRRDGGAHHLRVRQGGQSRHRRRRHRRPAPDAGQGPPHDHRLSEGLLPGGRPRLPQAGQGGRRRRRLRRVAPRPPLPAGEGVEGKQERLCPSPWERPPHRGRGEGSYRQILFQRWDPGLAQCSVNSVKSFGFTSGVIGVTSWDPYD